MDTILIIEDDTALALQMAEVLERYRFSSVISEKPGEIAALFRQHNPELCILDINLPELDGFQVCREIREHSDIPILFVSGRTGSMDTVMALTSGGDDYLTKPFATEVLIAKVQALLRRAYDYSSTPTAGILEHNGLVLNLREEKVSSGSSSLSLTRNEFRILRSLLEAERTLVSRDSLMDALWQNDTFVDDNTLTVNVSRLKKKLEEFGFPEFIETVKGAGYRVI